MPSQSHHQNRHLLSRNTFVVGIAALAVGLGGWFLSVRGQDSLPPVTQGTNLEVRGTLTKEGRYYQVKQIRGDTFTVINSDSFEIQIALEPLRNRRIRAAGSRITPTGHDFYLLWVNGTTIMEEAAARPKEADVYFSSLAQSLPDGVRACLDERLGRTALPELAAQTRSLTETDLQSIETCLSPRNEEQ